MSHVTPGPPRASSCQQRAHWQTHALKFPTWALGIVGIKHLMGLSEENDSLYASQFEETLRTLPGRITVVAIENALETFPFQNQYVKKILKQRFAMARPYLDDDYPDLRSYIKPGWLTCPSKGVEYSGVYRRCSGAGKGVGESKGGFATARLA